MSQTLAGTIAALVLSLLPIRPSVAQTVDPIQPNLTICNWAGLRSGIIRDTIYLDGGSLWWQTGVTGDGQQNTDNDGGTDGLMFTLNLSYPFDTTSFNETTSLLEPLSKTGGSPGNNVAPNYVNGAMFVTNNDLLLYGGLDRLTDAYKAPSADALKAYEAYQSDPETTRPRRGFFDDFLPDNMTRHVSNGAVASVPSENLGYYFGGLRGPDWAPTTTSSKDWFLVDALIEVDMSNMRSVQWSNNSFSDKFSPRAGAQLVWIPVGGQGVLIAIGGMTAIEHLLPGGLNDSQLSDAEERAPGFTTSLPVYDIVSKMWYMQNTTGEGPGPLTESCSVVAPAKDSSSFNIYIYGGYDGLNFTSIPSDDVWILSIPSFTWVKAYSGDRSHGRRGHRCERVYPDQMFVIGGVHLNEAHCVQGGVIQVFNLNTLEFQAVYDPRDWSDYAVPGVVTDVIGGDGEGGASQTANFSSRPLSSLFDTPYTKAISTYYPYPAVSGSPSGRPKPNPMAEDDGLAKWVAPVLGVVLTLIVLSIVAALLLFYRRRKLLRRNSMGGSTVASSHNNRILNWVNGMPSSTNPSVGKAEGSVTSTEVDSDPSVGSAAGGATEAAGQQLYEVEAKEKNEPAEMATSFHFQDHPEYPRKFDFAYGAGAPRKTIDPGGEEASQRQIYGLGLSSPSATISPRSEPSRPPHQHTHSDESYVSIETVPGPYSPEDLHNRPFSPPDSPSPTSDAASATFALPSSSKGGGREGGTRAAGPAVGTAAPNGAAHHRHVSSLSSNLYSPARPETMVSPQEQDRSRELAAEEPNEAQNGEGATDESFLAAGASSTQTSLNEGGVRRQATAGKKSSFGEMLGEDNEKKVR